MTGLVTGLLLARAGRRVAVLEARDVGAGTTGNSTAKLSLLQGTRLSHILERQSRRVAEAYVEANREGQAWLLRFCDDHGVPVQRRDAVTYAGDTGDSLRRARGEHEAATSLGSRSAGSKTCPRHFPPMAVPSCPTRHSSTLSTSWPRSWQSSARPAAR